MGGGAAVHFSGARSLIPADPSAETTEPPAPIRNGLQLMHLAGDDPQIVRESLTLMERQVHTWYGSSTT